MNQEQILKVVTDLSRSQGFYCGLLQHLNVNPSILEELEDKNFQDAVDFIMYIEG